jgi:hypothetical protein
MDGYLLLKMKGSILPDSFMAAHPATVCVWFGVTSMSLLCVSSCRARELPSERREIERETDSRGLGFDGKLKRQPAI